MRRAAKVASWVAGSILLVLIAIAVLFATLDWNRFRPTIAKRVSVALERPFEIKGDLEVSWRRVTDESGSPGLLPGVHVRVRELRLGNPGWATEDDFVTLEQAEFRLALLPLLRREVRIQRIELGGPAISLERLEDGRANWTLDQSDEDEASRWHLNIGQIVFARGQIRARDEVLDAQLDARVEPLGEAIAFDEILAAAGKANAAAGGNAAAVDKATGTPPPYEFAFEAKGRYRGHAVSGSGKLGGLLALNSSTRPFPLHAELAAGNTRVEASGTLLDPLDLAELDLQLAISGANLADLYPLIGVNLPDTPRYATKGRLSAALNDEGGAVYRYRDFSGRMGESDFAGAISYTASQPRPILRGELRSELLRLADLGSLIGADTGKEGEGDVVQAADRVLPDDPFSTERWREMDADVRIEAARIEHGVGPPLSALGVHLRLTDGVLKLDPLAFGLAGGRAEGSVSLHGREIPMQGHLVLKARELEIRELVPGFEPMETSLGQLNGDLELRGQGNSIADLLGSSGGAMQLIIDDGLISRSLMEIAGLNVGNYIVGKLFGDEEVRINCAVADLEVENGVMSSRLVVFDTENARVDLFGTASFASERLDFEVHPQSKGMRILSLRSPLYVRGSFKEPDAGVQAGPLMARGAGAVALGAALGPAAALLALIAPRADAASPCAGLLAEMQAAPAEKSERSR